MSDAQIKDLIGKTLISVTASPGNDEIIFLTDDGKTFRLFHHQDCCESVTIEDINGDLGDLVGSPITLADESSNNDHGKEWGSSNTWTFYKLATAKGFVDIRWWGSSNGYYSESVNFEEVI